MDLVETLERTHADSRGGIKVEYEEGVSDWENCIGTEGCQAVRDGGNGVFPDAVVDVAAGIGAC